MIKLHLACLDWVREIREWWNTLLDLKAVFSLHEVHKTEAESVRQHDSYLT